MPKEAYDALWSAARTVAHHLEERTGCERVVVVILGYEVDHVHIHLMPTRRLEDFPFPPVDLDAQARLEETAERLAWIGRDA
jgi:histidine triad (HIT) family protein